MDENESSPALSDDILDTVRYHVVEGLDNHGVVYERVLGQHPAPLGADPRAYEAELSRAVEDAFAARVEAVESWPPLTDCDRLRAAFDVLDKQGIVALEGPALTQDECIPYAASLAVSRDELGDRTHGYCFFTWNDLMRVLDGKGLSLAYGTFEAEPPQPPQETPAPCPICGGRGWVPPSRASDFPTPCSCKTSPAGSAPKPAAAAPTLGQKVGAAVLEACRGAGLDVEWTGSPEAYVELPRFRWQRRPVAVQESDVADFLESWTLEIRAGYTSPNELVTELDERAQDWFEDITDFGPRLLHRLRTQTEQLLEEEQRREAAWVEPTMNDRITAAFEELGGGGVFAKECLGLTIQDGWGYAGAQAPVDCRRVAFFHHEDVIDAVGGGALLLAFGAIVEGGAEDIEAGAALGHQIVSCLERHGVPCRWSQSLNDRIRIEPFEWQKRRWTKAPAYEKPSAVGEGAKRPSFLSRLFGKGATASPQPSETKPPVAPGCGAVVRALRDESGFNVRRARRMRAAWKAAGHAGDAQVGHVGTPHAFVRARHFTSMAPQLATWNLRDEKRDVFLSGLRGKGAQAAKP